MIQDLRVLLADIDGTLVQKGEAIMPKTRNAIIRLHEQGVLFGLATGRKITKQMFSRRITWDLPFEFDVMIGMNGGQLWDRFHQETEVYHLLSTDTMREIIDVMSVLHLNCSIYEDDHMVSLYMDPMIHGSMKRNGIPVILTDGDTERLCVRPNFNLLFRFEPEREKEVLEHARKVSNDRYTGVVTSPGIVEFMDPRVNKGLAVRKFSERNNIPIDTIMAFGDQDNDAGLVKEAGWGVCLLNGSDLTKSMADAITEYPCEEDGMGRYLEEYWLKPHGLL